MNVKLGCRGHATAVPTVRRFEADAHLLVGWVLLGLVHKVRCDLHGGFELQRESRGLVVGLDVQGVGLEQGQGGQPDQEGARRPHGSRWCGFLRRQGRAQMGPITAHPTHGPCDLALICHELLSQDTVQDIVEIRIH